MVAFKGIKYEDVYSVCVFGTMYTYM